MTDHPRRLGPPPMTHGATSAVPLVPCDVCGAPTLEVRCKIICRRCGYIRDCSDP